MYSKTYFIQKIIEESGLDAPRILELACGTARNVAPILKEHTHYKYVGLEPYLPSFEKARAAIGDLPNVTLINQLGYGSIPGVEEASFDIVFSLSALEHVKQLDKFIALSARYAKKDALVVHRYDLGHALYPGSLKERFQVFLGSTFPYILPEHKFVRYLPQHEVETELVKNGCHIVKSTFHQMLGQKTLEKYLPEDGKIKAAVESLLSWEFQYADALSVIPPQGRERLFVSPAVWAKKKL